MSHDQQLLAAAADEIWEIDDEDLAIHHYGLGYRAYLAEKRRRFEASGRAYQGQERRRQELVTAARRRSRRASSYEQRSTNSKARRKARKIARVTASQRSRIERELTILGEPRPPTHPRLQIRVGLELQGTALAF